MRAEITRKAGACFAGFMILALLAGCATIRRDYTAEPSYSFDRPQETTLGRAFAAEHAKAQDHSGFRLVNSGVGALMTRAALADLAERAIDIQYYIYDADEAGAFLMQRLVAAADRGVRVRMLFDDLAVSLDDRTLVALDAHPNIEIRVFDPFPGRSRWTRPLQLIGGLDQLGRRMHNKIFAVDGHAAILGGRNIGNRYFEAEAESNFRDLDILALGTVVRKLSGHFDFYWNNPLSVPVEALRAPASPGPTQYDQALEKLAQAALGPRAEYERRKADYVKRLLERPDDFIWAKGIAVSDLPVRKLPQYEDTFNDVMRSLGAARRAVTSEMVIQSAYFVPGERYVKLLSEMVARGVKVRVLTNSLRATDVAAVHAGYARYRPALLAGGIELHEYRSDSSRPTPAGHLMRSGSSDSALHSKVIVFDRRVVWVGSANLDPRSRRLNTETGLIIESEALAERVLKSIERDFSAQNSWKLELRPKPGSGEREVVWVGERDGQRVTLDDEPEVGLWRRLGVKLFSVLPGVEELL